MTIVNTAPPAPDHDRTFDTALPMASRTSPLSTPGTPGHGRSAAECPAQRHAAARSSTTSPTAASTDLAAARHLAATLLPSPRSIIRLDDAFFLHDIPGNQTPGGVRRHRGDPDQLQLLDDARSRPAPAITASPCSTAATAPCRRRPALRIIHPPATRSIRTIRPSSALRSRCLACRICIVLTIGSQGVRRPTMRPTRWTMAFTTSRPACRSSSRRLRPIRVKTGFGTAKRRALQITIDTVAPPVQFGFGAAQHGAWSDSDTGVVTEPETVQRRSGHQHDAAHVPGTGRGQFDRPAFTLRSPIRPIRISVEPGVPDELCRPRRDGGRSARRHQRLPQRPVDIALDRRSERSAVLLPSDGLRTSGRHSRRPGRQRLHSERRPGSPQVLQIFIDTQGPQVTGVFISEPDRRRRTDGENRLTTCSARSRPTTANQGPTPLTYAITINIQDLPIRMQALLARRCRFVRHRDRLQAGTGRGDQRQPFRRRTHAHRRRQRADRLQGVRQSRYTGRRRPAGHRREVQLRFVDANGNPIALPDDRYTLTINDTAIVDPAGNLLDGESNVGRAAQHARPESPSAPSGNGIPGGDFVARFTVDSRPEIGDVRLAPRSIDDTNGNFVQRSAESRLHQPRSDVHAASGADLVGKVSPMGVHDARVHRQLLRSHDHGRTAKAAPCTVRRNRLRRAGRLRLRSAAQWRERRLPLPDRSQRRRRHRAERGVRRRRSGFQPGIPLAGDFSNTIQDPATYQRRRDRDLQRRDVQLLRPPDNPSGFAPVVFRSTVVTGLRGYPIARNFNGDHVGNDQRPTARCGTWPPGRTTSSTSTTGRATSSSSTTRVAPASRRCRPSPSASRASARFPWPPTWTRTASPTSACGCRARRGSLRPTARTITS